MPIQGAFPCQMPSPLHFNGRSHQPADKMISQRHAQIEPVQYRWTKGRVRNGFPADRTLSASVASNQTAEKPAQPGQQTAHTIHSRESVERPLVLHQRHSVAQNAARCTSDRFAEAAPLHRRRLDWRLWADVVCGLSGRCSCDPDRLPCLLNSLY
jgi:hypothetical protein